MKINSIKIWQFKYTKTIVLVIAIVAAINLALLYILYNAPSGVHHRVAYIKYQSQAHIANQYIKLITSNTIAQKPKAKEYHALIAFLKNHIHKHPQDIYNSSYLETIGELYILQHAIPQAMYYYTLSITKLPYNQYPLLTQKKITLFAELEPNVHKKITYYNTLLKLYPNTVQTTNIYYMLAGLYDELSIWDQSYYYYDLVLDKANALTIADSKRIVEDLYFRTLRKRSKASKTWSSVEEARRMVQIGLNAKNSYYLKSLQAPGFFTTQWQESKIDPNSQIPSFNLVPILVKSNITFTNKFSPYSTANEILWNTVGWERVGTWHMVFRKIQQPDTININGRWEWAGIYFGVGNKFYEPN